MPADIYLVRHGQNEDNIEGILNGHRDRPLTELGREQARTVAKKLKDNGIQVIYSSPLKRAHETAQIIGSLLGLPVTVLPDLIERDFGCMTGRPVACIEDLPAHAILPTDGVTYFLEAEGSEDFPTLLERGKRVLAWVQAKHPEEHVLLVAHGDIGKMIRAAFHGWEWLDGLKTPYLDNTGVLELKPGADVLE
ncbi:MAG TPA: histidine phosphatase family protein [Verrucomicrobiae bacterium]|nr:histidine phosphatase family protein [Verrucomicrobiae bacterium]